MSIRSYNKRPLAVGSSIALTADCCCEEPPTEDQFESPCGCYDFWPHALTVELRGLEDYFQPGQGKCNCPLDGYADGFNQTVVLDFAGVITVDDCDPGQSSFSRGFYGNNNALTAQGFSEPLAVAVYRGSLQNGSCDAYGMEAALFPSSGTCSVAVAIDKLAASPGGPCEPWLQTSFICNSWSFTGGFDNTCSEAIVPVNASNFGGYVLAEQSADGFGAALVYYR